MGKFIGTPGPWHVSFHGPGNCWVVDADKEAAVSKIMQYKGDGTIQKANFNVISAAPELLDALQEMVKDLVAYQINARNAAKINNRWEGVAEAVQPSINKARDAINKALGR